MTQKILNLITFLTFTFSFSQIVISEIDPNTPGSDTAEFVELHSSLPAFSLDGYVLVFFNGSNNLSYYSVDLDGFVTDINGNFLIGNAAVTPSPSILFPNVTLQNGPDAVALYLGNDTDFPLNSAATTTNLIDAVAYGSSAPTGLMTDLGLTSFVSGETDTKSIQLLNGNYVIGVPSPGVNNDGSGIPINYITVTTSQASYNEGDSFNFVFTTSQPVQDQTLILNFTLNNGNFAMADFSGGLTVSIL